MNNIDILPGKIRQNNFFEKILLNKYFWIIFCGFTFIFPIYRSVIRKLPNPLPIYNQIPDYELTNQFGQKFGSNELKGKSYLVNFIFTRCNSSCPLNLKAMQHVQKRVKGLGTNIGIVSISVDPEFDTPNELLKKSEEYSANPYVWNFLTGDKEYIKKLVIAGFMIPLGEKSTDPTNGLMDIAHSNKIILVDSKNRARGFYDINKESIDKLMIDIGILINLPEKK